MASTRQIIGWQVGLWALVLLIGIALTPRTVRIYAQWWQTRQEVQSLAQRVQSLKDEGAQLHQQLQRLSTPVGKEALAREKGWLKPGEHPLHLVPE
jgi:cell division protein FtsL